MRRTKKFRAAVAAYFDNRPFGDEHKVLFWEVAGEGDEISLSKVNLDALLKFEKARDRWEKITGLKFNMKNPLMNAGSLWRPVGLPITETRSVEALRKRVKAAATIAEKKRLEILLSARRKYDDASKQYGIAFNMQHIAKACLKNGIRKHL